eukprot:GFYU01001603.1.p1 GENE.GFYU01001603.1~~GFYU01001603.1.p1  ORF type:complete len:250 (+),score=60.00 GFYU01001603.1:58-807(+)
MSVVPAVTVPNFVRFLSLTDGRDKLYRVAQYGCRFLIWFLANADKATLEKMARVEALSGDTRKMLRIVKYISQFHRVANDKSAWTATRVVTNSRDLFQGTYFFLDNVSLGAKHKILNQDPAAATKRAAKFWFTSILLSLLADIIQLQALIDKQQVTRQKIRKYNNQLKGTTGAERQPIEANIEQAQAALRQTLAQRQALNLNFVKNMCDLPLSFNSTGFMTNKLSNGLTGACGVLSSFIGAYQVWLKML